MIILKFIFIILITKSSIASTDLLLIGDSQVGATWSKSYTGNFLVECLEDNFLIIGRGATILSSWINRGNMDHIETIQRDKNNSHFNIGAKESVPLEKKRIRPMIKHFKPKKVAFNFGGNYISKSDDFIISELNTFKNILDELNIEKKICFFMTPTFEMEVKTRRNVPLKNIKNIKRISSLVEVALKDHCQVINGVELMETSEFYDGHELLKRIPIEGKSGCMGPAQNDNTHVCGKAAKDYAQRICTILNL